jgi:hypothetical protein
MLVQRTADGLTTPNDDKYLVFGIAGEAGGSGTAGANFLTSINPSRICPSKVKFDFYFTNAMSNGSSSWTLILEVIDNSNAGTPDEAFLRASPS